MQIRFTVKTLLITTAFFALCCAGAVSVRHSIVGRAHYAHRLEAHIESLYAKQPPNLNAEQWRCMVDWTRNLHGNSLIAFETSTGELAAFELRLKERLSGEVDAATIEWIWDEYADVCKGGRNYQRFRLMVNEELMALQSPMLLEMATASDPTDGG